MGTKISKTSYFSFTFKLNEKKEVPLKKFSLERGVTGSFCWRGGLIFNRGLEIF